MALVLGGDHATQIAYVTAAINLGVAVHDFAPPAGARQTDSVSETGYRGQVKHNRNLVAERCVLPDKRKHTIVVVRGINPVESAKVVIGLPERGFRCIELVEVLH